jgi:hypothetical protein
LAEGNGTQALDDIWTLDPGMSERGMGMVMGGGGNGLGQGSQKGMMKWTKITKKRKSDKSQSRRRPYRQCDWRYDGRYGKDCFSEDSLTLVCVVRFWL